MLKKRPSRSWSTSFKTKRLQPGARRQALRSLRDVQLTRILAADETRDLFYLILRQLNSR